MTNCDSIFNLLLIFETIHPFSINFASDRKELNKTMRQKNRLSISACSWKVSEDLAKSETEPGN